MATTLDWVRSMKLPGGGIACWPGGQAYPEVSGYLIPTLFAYGEQELARELADWLLTIQHEDGSFDGLDGIPRTFDTAACMEGLSLAWDETRKWEYFTAANRAEKWIRVQALPSGGLAIHPGSGETHAYTMRVSGLLGRKKDAAYWIKTGYGEPYRSHYAAYCLEGLLMAGRKAHVRRELALALGAVQSNGLLPMWLKAGWTEGDGEDACATAQIAALCLKVGFSPSDHPALGKMINGVRRMVDASGGVVLHGQDRRPMSWAAKYYLDMEYLLRSPGQLAIVVGIKHWEDITKPFVLSLQDHNPDLPVLIVDNASVPEYPDLPGAEILRLDGRVGYNLAMNAAVKHRKAEQYIFFNNDCLCDGRMVEQLADLNPETLYGSGVNPDIGNGTELQWSAWLVVSSGIWQAVGPFDEKLTAGFEDFDLELRAQQAGFGLETAHLPVTHLDKHTRFDEPGYKDRWEECRQYFEEKHSYPTEHWGSEKAHGNGSRRRRTKDDYRIDYEAWAEPKPFGFSGCFRLRNESQFMQQAILSHLPWLDEAVLVVQPSQDDTWDIAYRLAAAHENIRVCEYPWAPDWIDTPEFYAKDPDQPGHLVHMSNWAFTQCKYSWIVKVEGDVLAMSTFADIIERVKVSPDEHHYYGRVILNVAGTNCDQVSRDNPRNGGWDEAVVPNHPDYHFKRQSKWEVLQNPGPSTCMGWSGLHMKRCKSGKDAGWNGETYVPFTRESVRSALSDFNSGSPYPGPDDPLGADCIYEKDWIERYLNVTRQRDFAHV